MAGRNFSQLTAFTSQYALEVCSPDTWPEQNPSANSVVQRLSVVCWPFALCAITRLHRAKRSNRLAETAILAVASCSEQRPVPAIFKDTAHIATDWHSIMVTKMNKADRPNPADTTAFLVRGQERGVREPAI